MIFWLLHQFFIIFSFVDNSKTKYLELFAVHIISTLLNCRQRSPAAAHSSSYEGFLLSGERLPVSTAGVTILILPYLQSPARPAPRFLAEYLKTYELPRSGFGPWPLSLFLIPPRDTVMQTVILSTADFRSDSRFLKVDNRRVVGPCHLLSHFLRAISLLTNGTIREGNILLTRHYHAVWIIDLSTQARTVHWRTAKLGTWGTCSVQTKTGALSDDEAAWVHFGVWGNMPDPFNETSGGRQAAQSFSINPWRTRS